MDVLAAQRDLPSALATGPARRPADRAPPPVAVVVVPVPPGRLGSLRPVLASLARSRVAGDLPVAAGALAVLILAEEPEALSIAEAMAPDFPFPLRVETGPGDSVLAIRRAASWAVALGAADAPVLIVDQGRPVAPRWAYGLLSALRDGADMVTRRVGLWKRLVARPVPPVALSARAQWAMERWSSTPRRRGAWIERDSPWRRSAGAGLRTIAA
ncbi:MAG TPA: hypothetical protein VIL69_19370 [Roseomonas sp.]|jgi:hypothetical protein